MPMGKMLHLKGFNYGFYYFQAFIENQWSQTACIFGQGHFYKIGQYGPSTNHW